MGVPQDPSFGQRLRRERESHHWTQEQLADLISGSVPSIHRWENGEALPRAYLRNKLCEVFGKAVEQWGIAELHSTTWYVPYHRNQYFTGRDDILTKLHYTLRNENAVALTQMSALSGLGGIGKTQTALEYAYRYAKEYQAVLWIRADSRELLISDLLELAIVLGLPEQDETEHKRVLLAVRRWLHEHTQWLLILDNADDLVMVSEFLPTRGTGSMLLTTRAQATGTKIKKLELNTWSRAEAIFFLLRRVTSHEDDKQKQETDEFQRKDAEAIYELMDGLPLALDQAAAYIEENQCRLADYLTLYQTHRRALLTRRGMLSEQEYPKSVATTWSLSFQQVEQRNTASANLLCLCAFLQPDTIPEEMILAGAPAFEGPLRACIENVMAFNEALGELRRYSLIRRSSQTRTLSIHRLVQVALRDALTPEEQQVWGERTIAMMSLAFSDPELPKEWTHCQQALPHVEILLDWMEQSQITSSLAIRLVQRAGTYLQKRGQYSGAEQLLRRGLILAEQAIMPDEALIAHLLNDLGVLCWEQGQYEQAEPFYIRARTLRERICGDLHADTATTLNDLALLYTHQERFEEAMACHQRALTIWQQTYGPRHPQIAECLNNIGMHYIDRGDYVQAETAIQQAIDIWEISLETSHPHLAIGYDNLAIAYYYQDKFEQTEDFIQRALKIREQWLGFEHPDTANSLNNLGVLYRRQGKYEQAEVLLKRGLAIRERALGREHDRVANSLHGLARLYCLQKRYTEAETLFREILAIQKRILGPEHGETKQTIEELILLLRETNREEEANNLLIKDNSSSKS